MMIANVVLFLAGFLVQVVLVPLWPNVYFCPHVVLLLTLASGLLRGSIIAESFGFGWGLALDATGTTAFGVQGLILSLMGYLSGFVGRWINAEEPVSQVLFSLFGSVFYFAGLGILQDLFGATGQPVTWGLALSVSVVNVLAAPLVFLALRMWRVRH